MTKKLKNFRVQDGCYNCINMEDLSDYDTGYLFLCKLQFPDFDPYKNYSMKYVDENGICDDWKKDRGEEDMSMYYCDKRQASPPPTLAELMAKSRNDLVK